MELGVFMGGLCCAAVIALLSALETLVTKGVEQVFES